MKVFYLLLFLLVASTLSAQSGQPIITPPVPGQQSNFNPPGCLTDVLVNQKKANNPGFALQMQQMDNAIFNFASQQRGGGVITIPVVVHIVHNNGPENISNQQVLNGIQHLNNAFANTGPYNTPGGVTTGIQFCLAQQDPNGVYTTGITRTVSALTNMNAESQDLDLKNLIRWDPTRYLNIWLVNEITTFSMGSGVAGYAYFPSSHGQPEDGIVNEAALFGSTADNSKVHIHEAGHYLGLYHTFEGGCNNNNCQTDGDRVCDTPPDNSTNAVVCNANPNTCNSDDDDLSANNPFRPIANGGLGDQPDMFENYMDYGLQLCQNAFTQGQSTRMMAALTTSRASLLQSIGCNSVCFSPININNTTSGNTINIGGSVTFTITTPTIGATYTWAVNGVNFNTGTSVTRVFNTVGTYSITVTGTNNNPACTETDTIIVTVNCTAQASFTLSPAEPYALNATITATSTSTNATNYAWYLDGVLVGNNPTFTRQYTVAGGHNLSLVVSNNLCADTSAMAFFNVGDCTLEGMNANWAFSYKRLNFSTLGLGFGGSPMGNPQQEAVSTISDPAGNMLFTTDGMTVWDAGFNVMPNGTGLMGHFSSTQGVLASPYPGSNNLYYIFTTDGTENNSGANGFRYTIVDMSLNGGAGAVVANKKNILLRNTVCEKLTGTYHANGRDIWITVAGQDSRQYYSYLLTPAGIDTVPVVSTMGTIDNNILGGMKYSHDGNMVAACIVGSTGRQLAIAHFNKATGQFFNGFTIPYATIYQPYSIEFSPDNSKLYVSFWNRNHVFQYNLAAGSNAAIQASETRVDIYGPTPPVLGQLALGNNGKIYVYSGMSNALDVINSPNLAGTACNYTSGTGNLVFALGQGAIGLQNIITGLDQPHNPEITGPTKLCLGGIAHTYILPQTTTADVATWTYTGPGTMVNNGNNTVTITSGNTPGTGMLSVVLTSSCGIRYDTLDITTVVPQEVFIGNDTMFCNTLDLHTQGGFTGYLWSNGSTNDSITVTTAGNYWVNATDINGCPSRDTIALVTHPVVPPVNITASGILCTDGVVVLSASGGYESYEWQNGFPEQSFTAFTPGTYWVTATSGCTVDVDSFTVVTGAVDFNLTYNGDTVLCNPQLPITLTAPQGYVHYQWQNNSTNTTFQATTTGTYWLTVTNAAGCVGTDTFYIGTNPPDFQLTLNNDETPCGVILPAVIFGPQGYAGYVWNNNTSNGYLNIALNPGDYWLTVFNSAGCSATDTITVNGGGGSTTPVNLTYNGNSIVCFDQLPFTLAAPQGFDTYNWQDGSGNDSILITQPGTYWVNVTDSCASGSDTLIVLPAIEFELMVSGDTSACKNQLPFMLTAPQGYQQYLWQNGNAGNSIQVTAVGTYWVRVTNGNGCTGVDTFRVLDCTGIEENIPSPVSFYPNPANGYINIELAGQTPVQVSFINALGQVVHTQLISGAATINTQTFANGLYVLQATSGNKVWRQKLIVLH